MTTFEEQFPSLKDKQHTEYTINLYTEKSIMEYCLDKQKVRDVIDKIFAECIVDGDRDYYARILKKDLLNELRLCRNCYDEPDGIEDKDHPLWNKVKECEEQMVKKIIYFMCERCNYTSSKEFKKDKCPACGDGHAIVYMSEAK